MISIYYDSENAIIAAETKKFVEGTGTQCAILPMSLDSITLQDYSTDVLVNHQDTTSSKCYLSSNLYQEHWENASIKDTSAWSDKSCYDYKLQTICSENINIKLEVEHKMFNWFKI